MFTSKGFLADKLDINPAIAAFFVDRKVPVDNRYWQDRLLYVGRGTGFLFIPLFFDLQLRSGVPLEFLLSDEYVAINEFILHHAALYEAREGELSEHIHFCRERVKPVLKQQKFYDEFTAYLSQKDPSYKGFGTGNMALNRADPLLLALAVLPVAEEVVEKIVQCWYALVPPFLLLDDMLDLQEDEMDGEENAITSFATGSEAIKYAISFLNEKASILSKINPRLESFLLSSLEQKLRLPYIKSKLDVDGAMKNEESDHSNQ